MKNITFFQKILILFILLGFTSCDEDKDTLFLKRNTDAFNFKYLNTTQDLSVLTNGEWKVSTENDWISLSPDAGQGNGSDREFVTVTVSQNKGDAREGKILLSNSERSYEINVTQDEGHFSFGDAEFTGKVLLNQAADARIEIPYQKGADDDFANVTITLNGQGATGLSVDNLTNYQLSAGEGSIIVNLKGTATVLGEIIATINAELTTRNASANLTAKGRVKADDSDIDPLESPTVTLFACTPRLAVLDWGKYVKGSGKSRKFTLELALTQYGNPIRRYVNQVDWTSSASIGTGAYFYENNRFAFGDLEPNTTYWFRIIHRSINLSENLDSDMTYFEFKTPTEEPIGGNVLLYKDFDNFWFGGCPIYQAFAIMPTETQIKANLDPASDAVKSTDYRTYYPVGNIANPFGTVLNATNCPAMWKYYWDGDTYGYNTQAPGYEGWYGSNALPCTGSVRLATASAQGYLRTPKLSKIGSGTADITVTVNTAPYFEAYHSWGEDYLNHLIIVEGDGKIVSGGSTLQSIDNDKQATVKCKSNVNSSTKGPLGTHAEPTTHTINIEGATKNTQITIKTTPYSGTDHYRIWLDDIKIEKK